MRADDSDPRALIAEVDTVIAAFTDPYGRLLGKRFDSGFYRESVAGAGTHVCDYLFGADIEMEPQPGYDLVGWEHGYGDVHLVPDVSTLRRAGWAERTAIVLCDVHRHDHSPMPVSPRQILRRQIERLDALGLTARIASELEFFERDTVPRGAVLGGYIEDYHLLSTERTEPMLGELRGVLTASGVPVESTKGEFGVGQHELNLVHDAPMEMADRHVLVKHATKVIAERHGRPVTFMAKPFADQAGSSCHLHLSLWRDDRPIGGDALFEAFVAGWMAHVDDLLVWWAPTVNSYKRFVDGSWAPTRLAWSTDNRTAAFRMVGDGPARRIECRVPGADVNPYLAYAAAIAAGLAGVEAGLALPPPFRGDVYTGGELPRVAERLRDATTSFRDSSLARGAFGDDVVDHYAHFYDLEVAAFEAAVTDWERDRYAERI